ncbi:hypothetical protein [Phenylobacterium sp.]|jgi:hypothetical protein|uniref:hypothetical protein n=1 Tax=Phenylobacterium sp. TaxID=1871053 RepID=UPI002E31A9A1|nr:hypothetical protein [Phenylobacterium sp.]HEX2560869.1 hypothetical protein [Phenylobacterium sp.]
MTPKVPEVLGEIAGLIGRSLAPGGDPAEKGANLGLSAMLLSLAAQRWDGMAHALVEENRAIRPILARGEEVMGKGRWRAISQADEDFRISALEKANAELRAALLALHEAVETADGEAARELEALIWAELRASTERRMVAGSPV